eukprot:Gb_04961 [translate_table: standard]
MLVNILLILWILVSGIAVPCEHRSAALVLAELKLGTMGNKKGFHEKSEFAVMLYLDHIMEQYNRKQQWIKKGFDAKDIVMLNTFVNPAKYNSILSGLGVIWRETGPAGLWKGWGGKLFGYGAQGGCRFGLYEYFKKLYCDVAGPDNMKSQKTLIYLAGSASAQIIADVALCPFEAVKVQVQTQPRFAKGLLDGFPKLYSTEGLLG